MAPPWLTVVAAAYLAVCFAPMRGLGLADGLGFATSWPANVWLVKRGIKIPM